MKVKLEKAQFGNYLLVAEDNRDILFQIDYDFPSLASYFGLVPCECGYTDGTVDCEHKTTGEMIMAAIDYLDAHEGEEIDDPGYFD